VSPIKGIKRFRVKGKLAPRYIGSYQIQTRHREVAYQLSLQESLSVVHDVFYVSQLKKCLRVPEEQMPTEDLEVQEDLTYIEKPTQIMETKERVTRRSIIRWVPSVEPFTSESPALVTVDAPTSSRFSVTTHAPEPFLDSALIHSPFPAQLRPEPSTLALSIALRAPKEFRCRSTAVCALWCPCASVVPTAESAMSPLVLPSSSLTP
jgi:hypothetical protein